MAVSGLSMEMEEMVRVKLMEEMNVEIKKHVAGLDFKKKELVACKLKKLMVSKIEELLTRKSLEKIMPGEVERIMNKETKLKAELKKAVDDNIEVDVQLKKQEAICEEINAFCVNMEKKRAAIRKKQMKQIEGWMRCASCGKRGRKRCVACSLTTYCSLQCHQKHWVEGHMSQCDEIRKEFIEVVLKPDLDGLVTSCPKLSFIIQVVKNIPGSRMHVWTEDDSVKGDILRVASQEKAYDQILNVVEEQGLLEQVDIVGTFQKAYYACFIARFEGQTPGGNIRLKINPKQVQPIVMWF